jgi:hypothetical protein
VADRKPFLLRIDAALLEALQRWANDDLRSLNGQIEFLVRQALRASGRLPAVADTSKPRGDEPAAGEGHPGGQP